VPAWPLRRPTGLLAQLSGAAAIARAAWNEATRRSHPRLDGRLTVDGAEAPIEILRDRHGVPHVFACSERDAVFGQGFVHAQDRLFQMDSMRRLAAGRLAEAGGSALLAGDRFMRRLGLAQRARGDLETAPPAQRALLDAYAAGVNAGIDTLPALPPEFALLGPPDPWRPEDPMLVGRMVLFGFGGNWDTELLRERLVRALGPRRAAAVDAAYPEGRLTHMGEPAPGVVDRLLGAYEAAVAAGLPGGGASNAWAVAGARSRSGAPLLASDPHLETRMPCLFHVSHISAGDVDAAGADIAGVPGIAIGHNRWLAWGITAGMADVADCYVETLDAERPDHYLTPEGWAPGRVRVERIGVRSAAAVEERVLETRHGPVIGPALPGEHRAIALRSTALEAGDIVTPFLGIWRSRTVEQLESVLERWPGATFNWVFAHADGRIGYRMVGSVPRREPGAGLLPQDGARSPGPSPVLPPSALPRAVDPPGGVVVSANHAPGGELELGAEWCEPWRAERIWELIDDRPRHDVESFIAIQIDQRSEPLVRLRALLLARGAVADGGLRALLSAWDGQVGAGSAAAAMLETVFQILARELATRLAGPGAPIVLGEGVGGPAPHSSFHYRLQGWVLERLDAPSDVWADAPTRDRALSGAVARAAEELDRRLGRDRARWAWGALHPLRLNHSFRPVPLIGSRFSRGPFPFGGDVNTVSQGGYSVHRGSDANGFTPSYRQVIDLADFDRSRFQIPSGNSGIPGHPRYDDCTREYLAGEMRPLLTSRAAVDAAREHALRLEPRRAGGGRDAA